MNIIGEDEDGTLLIEPELEYVLLTDWNDCYAWGLALACDMGKEKAAAFLDEWAGRMFAAAQTRTGNDSFHTGWAWSDGLSRAAHRLRNPGSFLNRR